MSRFQVPQLLLPLLVLTLAACDSSNEQPTDARGAADARGTAPDAEPVDATASVADATVDATTDPSDAAPLPDADISSSPADIVLLGDQMLDYVVDDVDIPAGDCTIIEGCVGGPGRRRLLRFDTVTANVGQRDLVMGPVPAAGVSDDTFLWSACHGHHHVTGYADYSLLGRGGVVESGHKQAFCLMDTTCNTDDGCVANPGKFDCDRQGITAGWADTYSRYLDCQWIDVTDVAPGTYTLKIVVNPSQQIPEGDYNNNEFRMEVRI